MLTFYSVLNDFKIECANPLQDYNHNECLNACINAIRATILSQALQPKCENMSKMK